MAEESEKCLVFRLTSGEKVLCLDCKEGHYITDAVDVSTSHFFYCDKCGGYVHFDPSITVE